MRLQIPKDLTIVVVVFSIGPGRPIPPIKGGVIDQEISIYHSLPVKPLSSGPLTGRPSCGISGSVYVV